MVGDFEPLHEKRWEPAAEGVTPRQTNNKKNRFRRKYGFLQQIF